MIRIAGKTFKHKIATKKKKHKKKKPVVKASMRIASKTFKHTIATKKIYVQNRIAAKSGATFWRDW